MTDFKELVQKRRSHRAFSGEDIDGEDVSMILRAALMSPTSKNKRSWHFVVVDNKVDLEKIADAKDNGSQFVKDCSMAVVVIGNPLDNDCWIEDCSIAAAAMQWQAEELGIGSCWAQMRARGLSDGTLATEVIRGVLDIPEDMEVLCVIGFGHKAGERKLQDEDKLKWENVHINRF